MNLEKISELKSRYLVLDTEYFEIVKRDEKESRYNYIERDIGKNYVVLLKRDIVDEIIESAKSDKKNIEGIYPLFLMDVFSEDKLAREYVEVEEDRFLIVSFEGDRVCGIENILFSRSDLLEDPSYLEDFLDGGKEIFSYRKFDSIPVKNWREYRVGYREEIDFLPREYRKKIVEQKKIKLMLTVFLILVLLALILSAILSNLSDKKEQKIYLLQQEVNSLNTEISESKNKIIEINESLDKQRQENKEEEKISISGILERIFGAASEELHIFSVDYADKIYILGETKSLDAYYDFISNLRGEKINQDFLKFQEEVYRFRVEVSYD